MRHPRQGQVSQSRTLVVNGHGDFSLQVNPVENKPGVADKDQVTIVNTYGTDAQLRSEKNTRQRRVDDERRANRRTHAN